MDDKLMILAYGGIAVIVVLLIIFEMKEGRIGNGRNPQNRGYEYYTEDGSILRIHHAFGSLYKVYTISHSPVPTKKDRFGMYFTVRARSTSDAEHKVDSIYRR